MANRLLPGLGMALLAATAAAQDHLAFPGHGEQAKRHVVLLAGDEEYRSEEGLPQLAKILSVRHGFRTTVLFSLGRDGAIDPNAGDSLSHPEALDSADAIVMLLRFRHWPDDVMARFVAAVNRGVPLVALRTSTHPFNYPGGSRSPYAKYTWTSKEWPGGFGRQVLGETWVAHHGQHGKEGTRGVPEPANAGHPALRGVTDVFGDTDVYTANPPRDAAILLRGQVTDGLTPASKPVAGRKNNPMQPVAWTRELPKSAGAANRILCTTMGAATDLKSAGLRRLVVNGVYWGLRLEVPAEAAVDLVGDYKPSRFGFNAFRKGVKPADLR